MAVVPCEKKMTDTKPGDFFMNTANARTTLSIFPLGISVLM
jgi:hypothetical protein